METRELECVVDRMPLGVVWAAAVDHVGLNAAARNLLGMTPTAQATIGELRDRVKMVEGSGAFVRWEECPFQVVLSGRHYPRTQLQVVHPDGSRVALWASGHPAREQGEVALVFLEDCGWADDDRKKWSYWLGVLGHEVRGALHAVGLGLSLLDKEATSSSAKAAASVVRKNLDLLEKLATDVLDVGKAEFGSLSAVLQELDLGRCVSETLSQDGLVGPSHHLRASIEEDVVVRADPARVRQILLNLLSNADRHSAPGTVWVTVRRRDQEGILLVRDEGPGIPADLQRRLFKPYVRAPSRSEGSGLGLWLSRELALRMGGDLWVTSNAGAPTTFFVAFPLEDGAVLRPAARQ